ncbi:MAG: hypothetical protein JXA77_14895 [Bacteroidales bacterium]|nr:hypothetical protein [Bacteroidales bacterium]MBN2819720.1 hypothetical protein [Bacteroidales bacterium]
MPRRYLLILVQAIALSLVFLVYYQFVFKPAEKIVNENILSNFENKMTLKSYFLDNTISRYIEGAKSISSRTMIRNKIEEYKKGSIGFAELKEYTTNVV